MLKQLTLSLLVLFVLVAGTRAEAPARWGALAVCPSCGASGGSLAWSYGHSTREDAIRDVSDRVRQDHSDVKILCVTSDRYIAVAFSRSGSIGYEHGDNERETVEVASIDCSRSFGPPVKHILIDNGKSRVSGASSISSDDLY